MNTYELTITVNKVIDHLVANGFDAEADELRYFLANVLANNSSSIDAAKSIYDRCHIKWLGDLSVQELTLKEWIELLEQVKLAAIGSRE